MKYIVFDAPREIVLFGLTTKHSVMAGVIRRPVLSAGFVKSEKGDLVCFGRSDSLDVESRGKFDVELIHEQVFLSSCLSCVQ